VPIGFVVVVDDAEPDPVGAVEAAAAVEDDDVVDGSVELVLEPAPAAVVVDVESAVVDRAPEPREQPAPSTARTRKRTRSFTAAHPRAPS
jgi:hypothetical protein